MEHIVQFGISIDDDAIKKSVERNVMSQVASTIKQDVMKIISGKKECSNYEYATKLKEIVTETTVDFLEQNREEIIKEASKKLVERLEKTKAVRDAVNCAINGVLGY